jgi:hypothetical protein
MRRLDLIPLTLLGVLAAFVSLELRDAHVFSPAQHVPGRQTISRQDGGAVDHHPTRQPRGLFAAKGRVSETVRRLRRGQTGTYIGEILLDHDSSLARWPDNTQLDVWIQPTSTVKDWTPLLVDQVRSAFTDWQATGIPVRFRFIGDSGKADIHVTWLNEFSEPISGKTLWARDDDWWIVDADITIALHHNGGEPLDAVAIRAIALHEVGHVIGLDHTRDVANIMTPRVRVRDLSAADRATARLLYTLPAGPVR